MGTIYTLRIPDSMMINSGEGQQHTYTIEPEFNYLAVDYNDKFANKDEKYMATPYSEITQNEDLEEVYQQMPIELASTIGGSGVGTTGGQIQTSLTPFNIINGGNIDQGNVETSTGAANPRQIFLGNPNSGKILNRDATYLDSFENILLLDATYLTTANNVAKQFPQYVKIHYGGYAVAPTSFLKNSLLDQNGAMYNLVADFVINRYEESRNEFRDDSSGKVIPYWTLWKDDQSADTLLQTQTFWDEEGDPFVYVNPVSLDDMSPTNRDDIFDTLIQKTWLEAQSDFWRDQTKGYLFFKIEKYKGAQLIQSFWTTNLSTDGSSFTFYDTQVKPQVEYTYKCFGYWYQHSNVIGNNKQETRIFEVPLFSQSCKIEQPSLPTPQVQFSNIKDSKNKIKIMLNQSANSENLDFYGLYEGEKAGFDERKSLYDLVGDKDNFVYETDMGRYEVFKMSEQPEMGDTADPYKNIADNSTISIIEGSFGGTAAHHIDTIKPFTKYYYTFRCLNHYGYPSLPTPIWEIELTKDANETFLNSKVVGFAKPNQDKYAATKTMMRMLQIVPSLNQTTFEPSGDLSVEENNAIKDSNGREIFGYIDEAGVPIQIGFRRSGMMGAGNSVTYLSGIEDRTDFEEINEYSSFLTATNIFDSLVGYNPNNNQLPSLGTVPETIWSTKDSSGTVTKDGKRFKVRITSKDSGRKIDFNLRFVLNKNYN